MKRELMEALACPACDGDVEVGVAREEGGEVIGGPLNCPACHHSYPISQGMPHLLPAQLLPGSSLTGE
jgi:uncharacterized protein YbaR (Trm112 family)